MESTRHSTGGPAPANRRFGRAARSCLLGLSTLLLVAGCGTLPAGTPPTATQAVAPDAADCPVEKISVTDVRSFQDPEGAWRVVGVIENRWDRAISKILTKVEALDATGKEADHGEDISAYPLNLQPGGRAPFVAWIKRDFPGVAHFEVVVEECVTAEALARGQVDVRGSQMVIDDAGMAQVTGDLVNTGPEPVLVNGLMATVVDKSGLPLTSDNATLSARYLGPGERGPFRATLYLPPASAVEVGSFQLYMDTVITEPQPALLDGDHDLRVTSRYVDSEGRFHVVGEVTNRGQDNLMLRLAATVYDGPARGHVLDASYLDLPAPIRPGETRLVDFTDWGPADSQRQLRDHLTGPDVLVELRVEPFASWTVAATLTGS